MKLSRIAAAVGLPALVLGSLTTSAAATGTPPAPGPSIVKHSVEDGQCDHIRFLPPQTDARG